MKQPKAFSLANGLEKVYLCCCTRVVLAERAWKNIWLGLRKANKAETPALDERWVLASDASSRATHTPAGRTKKFEEIKGTKGQLGEAEDLRNDCITMEEDIDILKSFVLDVAIMLLLPNDTFRLLAAATRTPSQADFEVIVILGYPA
ncbi:hypothetical protein V5O48_008763 [Marasmius crinis-equi]|uniref:Uncharacterized protein n=1 Tax=Marasmius crinis-equi TaxID=585013 RepID=A0ABR3FD01_9AGAR